MPDFSHSLPMLLMRAREAVMRRFRPQLRSHDVTEQQWRVLRALTYFGKCEVTELAHATFLHASSLSRILRDLVRRGLVQRAEVAADRRRGVVSISKRGRDLMRTASPELGLRYSEIRQVYGLDRLETLQRMLRELETALGLEEPGQEVEE